MFFFNHHYGILTYYSFYSTSKKGSKRRGVASATPLRYIYFLLITFLILLFIYRAELALEASGTSVAPPERARSAKATFLPPPPGRGGTGRRRALQDPSSESDESGTAEEKNTQGRGEKKKG